jgi:NifU-like protein involved in Fe-S cluster formation
VPSVLDYFHRACLRDGTVFTGVPGEPCFDREGNSARFWIEVRGAEIARARFQCTTCCTLVGLCEHAAELLAGRTIAEAACYSSRELLMLHPEVPKGRRDRASLAAEAIRSAALRAQKEAYS